MEDKEMLNELIVESREHLETIEPDLLELEKNGSNVPQELINRVFRAVHSIKGGFGFFAIETIVHLSHAMETVMSRVRDKQQEVTPQLTDALLTGVDKLRALLDDVANAQEVSITSELELLAPFLDGSKRATAAPAKVVAPAPKPSIVAEGMEQQQQVLDKHSRVSEKMLIDSLRNGKLIYQVAVNPQADILDKGNAIKDVFEEWEKFGEILDSVPSRELIDQDPAQLQQTISVVYATVLEPDLIAEALEMNPDQVLSLDLKHLKNKSAQVAGETVAQTPQAIKGGETGAQRQEARIEEALRVKVGLLNSLMNQAGELVLARNQLLQTMTRRFSTTPEAERIVKSFMDTVRASLGSIRAVADKRSAEQTLVNELTIIEKRLKDELGFSLGAIQGVNAIVQNIDMVTSELQENIMQTRMQPISVVFNKFPRVMRDLAKSVGKEVTLTLSGQDVELDKSIIEMLSDPLTHLVRNCADHGIENPELRVKNGKSREGTVLLRAYQEGGKVIIEIQDDGAGIDAQKVKNKAIEKGLITREKAAEMADRELQSLIFAPGFSTAEMVSNISGRGVGMDVVRTNIERLGGTVELDSELGQGTLVTMNLPLTLAIIPSLIVVAEGRRFAVPQVGLEEVVRIRAKDITSKIERVHDSEVMRLRGSLLPLVRLAAVLEIDPTFVPAKEGEPVPDKRQRWSDRRGKKGVEGSGAVSDKRQAGPDRRQSVHNAVKVIVLRIEKNLFGLVVDDVLDSEEIVVKPLPDYIKGCQSYAGTTIMGDGRIAMILDPGGVAELANLRFESLEKEARAEQEAAERAARRKLEDMLLFSIGGPEHLAVKLASVARIEKRAITEINQVGSKEFLKFDNSSLRLIRLENLLPIQPSPDQSDSVLVIVPKHAAMPVGFVAQRVEDTIQTEVTLDKESVAAPGIAGSAIIGGNLTVVLDMPALLEMSR